MAATLGFALAVIGCNMVTGSGNVKSESRDVSGFSEVALLGSGSLSIEQTGTESLTIEADDNVLPLIQSTVSGGRLTIGPKENTSITNIKTLNYKLTVKDLNALDLSGSGNVTAPKINSDAMSLKISGSGNISIGVTANSLGTTVSGSGEVTVSGKAARQQLTISGSGNYKAGDLESKEATVKVSGSGNATLKVSDALDATISGSGNIEYTGNPTVTQNVSGSGRVTKR